MSHAPGAAHPDSEFSFLTCLERHFPREHPSLLMGRGDDCAIVAWPEKALISTDMFIEDVHFRRSYFPPEAIGHKALAVNLSDIAGMGGKATGFCLCVQAPAKSESDLPPDFWDRCFAGMAALAKAADAPLVGGDLSRAPVLGFSITVWGQSERPVPRGGCSPGDILFVCSPPESGAATLGLARCGLLALEETGHGASKLYPAAVAAHLTPRPLLDTAGVLAAEPGVNSLMDLSDGLATDLPRLLGAELAPHLGPQNVPGVSIELREEALHPDVLHFCRQTGRDPLRESLLGGEDYCLIGACSQEAAVRLASTLPGFLRIGNITEAPGIRVGERNFQDVAGPGFDHFRER